MELIYTLVDLDTGETIGWAESFSALITGLRQLDKTDPQIFHNRQVWIFSTEDNRVIDRLELDHIQELGQSKN